MPITPERRNIEELRAAGFSETQAIVLAGKLEATAQAVSEDLKAFIVAELDKRFAQMEVRFAQMEVRFGQVEARFAQVEARIAEQGARFEHSLRVQLATILSAFVGVTTLAVAVIKLF